MENMTDEKIQRIITVYKKQRDRDKRRYELRKQDPEFMERNRQRARLYHQKNRQNKKDQYQKNIDFMQSRNLLNYYKKLNRLDDFKSKYPDKIVLLENHGIVV